MSQTKSGDVEEISALDPTRRKRLQNRLAQQRYRKKLRKHIEDLEQRAGERPASLETEPQSLQQDSACHMPNHAIISATASRSPEKSPLPLIFSTPDQTEDGFSDFVGQSALWDQPWASLADSTQRHGDDSNTQISIGLKTPMTVNTIDKDLFTPAQRHETPFAKEKAPRNMNQARESLSVERPNSQRNPTSSSPAFKRQGAVGSQSKSDPWDTQLAQISKFVSSLGFQNFDELVAFYYSGDFEVGSMAHSKQKLSRGRNLPGVLRTLHDSAATWSTWESSGYQNEILQAAEDILVEEIDQAISPMQLSDSCRKDSTSLRPQVDHQFALPTNSNDSADSAGQSDMRTSIVEEVPNLWAFVTAVLSGESHAVRKAKQKTLLALVAMLSAEQHNQGTGSE